MCSKCLCQFCAYNCELHPMYTTPREVDHCCFTCDECKHYDGDTQKRSQWRTECPKYREAAKRAEHRANIARSKLTVVGGKR